MRVAAIQMCAELGAVEQNCASAERLVRDAFAKKAEWVILPEFFTSGMAYHPRLLDAARPCDGMPLQMLCSLAREHSGVVGGSFLSLRGSEAYNTFALAFPDGSVFAHDKDLPTMWENCYYVGGDDDGVLETPTMRAGVAMCWELIRSQTARRLAGRVDVVVGGSCWWDFPDAACGPEIDALRARNRAILAAAPGSLARMLGVPVIHASHAGEFEGLTPGSEEEPYRSRWLGEAQIVDAKGRALARRTYDEGKGVLVADICPGPAQQPSTAIPARFWIPDLPEALTAAWNDLNAFGRQYYRQFTIPHRQA